MRLGRTRKFQRTRCFFPFSPHPCDPVSRGIASSQQSHVLHLSSSLYRSPTCYFLTLIWTLLTEYAENGGADHRRRKHPQPESPTKEGASEHTGMGVGILLPQRTRQRGCGDEGKNGNASGKRVVDKMSHFRHYLGKTAVFETRLGQVSRNLFARLGVKIRFQFQRSSIDFIDFYRKDGGGEI